MLDRDFEIIRCINIRKKLDHSRQVIIYIINVRCRKRKINIVKKAIYSNYFSFQSISLFLFLFQYCIFKMSQIIRTNLNRPYKQSKLLLKKAKNQASFYKVSYLFSFIVALNFTKLSLILWPYRQLQNIHPVQNLYCYFNNFIEFQKQTMQEEILGAQEEFSLSPPTFNNDPAQNYFNQVVMALQQVIIDQQFQSAQTQFMSQNCDIQAKPLNEVEHLFKYYKQNIGHMLNQKICQHIEGFDLFSFVTQMSNKQNFIDQQISEILLSCVDLQSFKTHLNDYRVAQEEEERYRVLTIKTNKVPENKKIKGNSENIFGSSNIPIFGNKSINKKTNSSKASEKSLDQVFVPETVLTVKGLRKC